MQVSDSELSEHHNNGYPTITLFCAIPINILLRDLRNTIFRQRFWKLDFMYYFCPKMTVRNITSLQHINIHALTKKIAHKVAIYLVTVADILFEILDTFQIYISFVKFACTQVLKIHITGILTLDDTPWNCKRLTFVLSTSLAQLMTIKQAAIIRRCILHNDIKINPNP